MNLGCPLCNTENNTIIYDQLQSSGALIVKCDHCTHVYTLQDNPAPIEELYATEVYKLVENRHSLFDKILSWEYSRVVKSINRLKPLKGFLLDFGCGKGKFGSLAKKTGWQVKCVETAPERASYAKDIYGLEVNTRFYSTGKIFNNDFDVLTLFHVLEHLPSPKASLKELIKHNLKKDALIVIEVPNINSWQSAIAGNKWMHLDIPRHFNHFTSSNLERVAAELKLRTIKSSSFSFHLGVLGMIDSFLKLSGYKKNIIHELKNRKNIYTMASISILLPFAFLLEALAAAIGRGGIIRKYFIPNY
jgi:2-polyprenyl-3-methyl-5-hydroxy-6-metoxy-1,4-benzoquinol methylase